MIRRITIRKIVIAAAVVAWAILVWREILPAINTPTQGFVAYYTASYVVTHGGAADLEDDSRFAVWLRRAGIDLPEVYAGNTPTLALLMLPLIGFSPATAQTLWLTLNVIMLVVCTWLAGRLCAPSDPTVRWGIAAIFPLLAPVRETIHFGQVYLLLALLSLLVIQALRRGSDLPAGLAVAAIILIKPYYGLLALALLTWTRRRKATAASLAAVVLVILATLPILASAWPGFLQAQASITTLTSASIPANQTLASLFQHLFVYNSDWNPKPLMDLPWLATGLRWLLSILLAGITLWRVRDEFALWGAALILMPVLSPVGEPHHYTLLLFPVALAILALVDGPRTRPRSRIVPVLIVGGILLLTVPWPNLRDMALWEGWRGLFAYPRVVGALLLWLASVIVARTAEEKAPGVVPLRANTP